MIFSYTNFYAQNQLLKILRFNEFFNLAAEVAFDEHQLNFYGMVYLTKGTYTHKICDADYTLEQGDCIFISPGNNHHFTHPIKDVEGYVISFTEEFIITSIHDEFIIESYKILQKFNAINFIKATDQNVLYALFNALYLESRNQYDQSQRVILYNILMAILKSLERTIMTNENNVKNHDYKYYNLAFQYKFLLRKHILEENNIHFYLEKLQVSQSTLQSTTKKVFNQSPKAMLDESIIIFAKQMLLDPCKRIQDISFKLGFSEPTNFTKFFKKHTGQTPESFRHAAIHQ